MKVTIDRNAVNVLFDIKRTLPSQAQEHFKIADARLIEKLHQLYLVSESTETKALIQHFFEITKTELSDELTRPKNWIDKVIPAKPRTAASNPGDKKPRKPRYYRGAPID